MNNQPKQQNEHTMMKLRFEVNQAECLRKGIDAPKSIVVIKIDPASLCQKQRDLLADRLRGIDVLPLHNCGGIVGKLIEKDKRPQLIVAEGLTFEDLMTAVIKNEAEIQASLSPKYNAIGE